MAKTPNLFPALRSEDGHAAIDFLARAFGFEQHVVHADPSGGVAHAQMTFGPGMIMLGSARRDDAHPWANVAQGIYVHVVNIDAHYRRAKAAGAQIVLPLQETSYGSREYSARDLDGHLWGFGTYDPFA